MGIVFQKLVIADNDGSIEDAVVDDLGFAPTSGGPTIGLVFVFIKRMDSVMNND